MNNDTTLFIGLEPHKSFTQVALLKDNRGEIPISYGRIDTSKSALIKLAIESKPINVMRQSWQNYLEPMS